MSGEIPLSREMDFVYGEARELRPGIRRIVANNPGPFTFKGTNTYLVGTDQIAVIDPGPDDTEHLNAVLEAAGDGKISHIILTHTHRDHCDGLDALKRATGAETWAMAGEGMTRGTAASSPSGEDFTDISFRPDHRLRDGDRIAGDGWSLTAVHTPGHAPDHLCFVHGTEDGPSGAFFSGDHVMGWSTSVVAPPEGNMGDYMRSLERLLDRQDEIFLPGHGGAIRTPRRVVKAYIVHRKWRENAIVDCIRSAPCDLATIVAKSYPSLDPKLIPAAEMSVFAHVELLIEKNVVVSSEPGEMRALFSLASPS